MAVSANTVWEFRTTATASNVNGGGFVTGASGTDYSQQDAAQYNLTGVTSAGAGNTVLTASAATNMVGNIARVISGTNFTTTNPWFEIVSVVAGVSITFGTNSAGASITTGVGATGVINIGGALSMNSTLDDDILEQFQPGNIGWVKTGTYTMGEGISIASFGTAASIIQLIGYNATRGDTPTGSTRPTWAFGANSYTTGQFWRLSNLQITGTSATLLTVSTKAAIINCKVTNLSTTANRVAISGGAGFQCVSTEVICYRGIGISIGNAVAFVMGCYIHGCNIGISGANTNSGSSYINNIFEGCVTEAFEGTGGNTVGATLYGNTFYGAQAKLGIGVSIASGSQMYNLRNNIFYGFVTGVIHGDAQTVGLDDYNCYNNNTTDVTNWVKGPNDTTLNPTFTSVQQITGSTATTSGSVLTQSGADFSTVIDNQDMVYIASGTGVTAGYYGITAHTTTTLTLDIAPGTNATADKVFTVFTGHNFGVGTNLKGIGSPGAFPGGLTTGYMDIGAAQRQATGGGTYMFVG